MREVTATLFKDENRLTTQQKSEVVLRRLQQSREPIAVIPTGRAEEFTSMILALDRGKGEILIDELNPEHGNAFVLHGDPFFCLGKSEGVYVGFETRVIDRVMWEGYGALRVHYPKNTYYLQRRSFFRVLVNPGDINRVEIERRGARNLTGTCHDISGRGMRLLLTSPTDFVLSEGEYLPQVRFELEGVELASEARVRFVGPVRNTRIRQPMRPVGIEFLNMSPNFEQRVMAYVQRRDRETLRERERRY